MPNTVNGAREQKKAQTRRTILDAAVKAFARLGYDGTNFREITGLCGVQRPLILYHYQSKENLWRVVAEEVEYRFDAHFEKIYRPRNLRSDRERVRYALTCYVDTLCAVPEYGQILLREGSSEGPRMEWLARHFMPRQMRHLELDDPGLLQRMRRTVLRDILASSLVAFVALGPLMERALAEATRQPSAGVHPLSDSKKREFVDYLLLLVFGS